jgi:tRNA(adenine34) deaminase
MREALKEAQKAFDADEVPVGAIVVCNNKIIARAHNLTERLNDVTAHAEMQAITAAANYLNGKYLNECTMYITLEPCVMCAGAIAWAQLGKLVYGAPDTKRGFHLLNEKRILHPKTEVISGILEKESADLIKTFFQKKR